MSRTIFVLLVSLVTVSAGASVPDLQGTALVGEKTVADAVVWLEAPNAARPARPAQAVLDQRNLSFSPHVLAVQVGTTVKFPNDDRVFHDVFSFHDGKVFSLGFYPVGASRQQIFDRAGLSRIFCNIHPQMAAYIMAVDSPYFAVSDSAGHFTIHGAPPGPYTYRAWRPGGAILSNLVAVGGTDALAVRWP